MNTDYNASSIVILTPDETTERFGWIRVETLAANYRKPAAWIGRGLEACRRAGFEKSRRRDLVPFGHHREVDDDYFERRYLKHEPIPRNEIVDTAMRDILRADR